MNETGLLSTFSASASLSVRKKPFSERLIDDPYVEIGHVLVNQQIELPPGAMQARHAQFGHEQAPRRSAPAATATNWSNWSEDRRTTVPNSATAMSMIDSSWSLVSASSGMISRGAEMTSQSAACGGMQSNESGPRRAAFRLRPSHRKSARAEGRAAAPRCRTGHRDR